MLPKGRQNCGRQVDVRHLCARIIVNPKIAGFYGLRDVAGDSFIW